MENKLYACIDLKSFYASAECVERGLDPLRTALVVADKKRTDKTICLAASPAIKSFGVPSRARLFEVISKVKEVNFLRSKALKRPLKEKSFDLDYLNTHPACALDFIVAKPQMAKYIKISAKIYAIYLKYFAKEDIHVYSIDEVFIDLSPYIKLFGLTPFEFIQKVIQDILSTTGVTATAGIGTNLYLAKVGMDILAKKTKPLAGGVRIAYLDEAIYKKVLWSHEPLTDFWRVGRGYANRLEALGLHTMGDIARCSLGLNAYYNEDLLYREFGVNAELLIDHAWGIEPVGMPEIKAYKPNNNSLSSGQVLQEPYTYEKGLIVLKEMVDSFALELFEKGLVTDYFSIYIGYDSKNNLTDIELDKDYYGRVTPKASHGGIKLKKFTSSAKLLRDTAVMLYEKHVDKNLLIRRINIAANDVILENCIPPTKMRQLDLFTDYDKEEILEKKENDRLQKERRGQAAISAVKQKYGKNAIIKGIDLEEGATAIERNKQIGGHNA